MPTKQTNIRIDPELKEYALSYASEFEAQNLSEIFNGILHVIKYGKNPTKNHFKAVEFLNAAVSGNLATQQFREQRSEGLNHDKMVLFYKLIYAQYAYGLLSMWSREVNPKEEFYASIQEDMYKKFRYPMLMSEVKVCVNLWVRSAESVGLAHAFLADNLEDDEHRKGGDEILNEYKELMTYPTRAAVPAGGGE